MSCILWSVALLLSGAASPAQEGEPRPLPAAAETWPQWRGPLGTGFAPGADPPLRWSEEQNLCWKSALPGLGHSSPIVHGELVFLTSAQPVGEAFAPRIDDAPGAHDSLPVTHRHEYLALAYRRTDGSLAWKRGLHEEVPHEGGHLSGSYASASPVTDGERLYVSFGSRGLYCLDLEGNPIWEARPGRMSTRHAHGEGSSPVLCGDTLLLAWDHEGDSRLFAWDARTGELRWSVERDEETSWATPVTAVIDGQTQVIASGTNRIRGYALEDGRLLWECEGLSENIVATPVMHGEVLIAGSSYEKQVMVALHLAGASGDLSRSPHLLWVRRRSTPYVPSPLALDGWVWFLNHYQGFLCRVEVQSGKEPDRPLRIEGLDEVYSSPVAAPGRIYLFGRNGLGVVVRPTGPPVILARNQLDDSFSATPALVGREIYLRGERHLYCIAESAPSGR